MHSELEQQEVSLLYKQFIDIKSDTVIVLTFITLICGVPSIIIHNLNEPASTDKLKPCLWLYVPRARRGDKKIKMRFCEK